MKWEPICEKEFYIPSNQKTKKNFGNLDIFGGPECESW